MLQRTGIRSIRITLSLGLVGCALALHAPSGWGQAGASAAGTDTPAAGVRRGPDPAPSGQIDALLTLIVTWLSRNFELPAHYAHPRVARIPADRIAVLRFGTASRGTDRGVAAVYDDERRTIFVAENWTGRTPAELSILVHEMVHHLQNLDGQTFPSCPGARERLAYDAQEKWLGLFGLSLTTEFEVDPFTVKALTLCR